MQVDLSDMRLFVNVADSSNLTRGAERSHLSVPAASTRIKNLEEGLGVKLLYRGPQGVSLTPPGEAFAHHARLILQQLESLNGDLQDYTSGLIGHLRMFAGTSAVSEYLPAVLATYLPRHPDVTIDLRERSSADTVRALIDGQADIGIVSGEVSTEGLQTIGYGSDRLVLAVSPRHPLAGQASVSFAQTLAHRQIGLAEGSALHQLLRQQAEGLNRRLPIRVPVGSFEAACRLVEANAGICILPEPAACRYARAMSLCLVPLQDEWSDQPMYVCVRSVEQLPSFARDLLRLLQCDAELRRCPRRRRRAGAGGTAALRGAGHAQSPRGPACGPQETAAA
ncbi:MAG: LysR family transcriptional regulator [Burkholderiales bacterium]|nr:LysR family transcriptional regulator [Burkholderiales bacterium]